jgi:hypothetical protein
MRNVSNDILTLQTQLTKQTFDAQKLEQGMIKAFQCDLTASGKFGCYAFK